MNSLRLIVCVCSASLLALSGCGEDALSGDGTGDAGTAATDSGGTTTDSGSSTSDAGGDPLADERVLSFVGTSPIDVDSYQELTLSFALVDGHGEAVSGESVTFSSSGSAAALGSSDALTSSAGEATVTIVAGYDPGSVEVTASSANAEDVVVGINVVQPPTLLGGGYDVLLHMDLGDALPNPYDTYLEIVAGVLHNPVGYGVYQALLQANTPAIRDAVPGFGAMPWFMDYPCADGSNEGNGEPTPSFECVETMAEPGDSWTVVTEAIESLILMGTDAADISDEYAMTLTVSDDISDLVTDFEVGARFDIEEAAGADGAVVISESWRDYVFEWALFCDEGDRGCARRVVTIDESRADRVGMEAQYGGASMEVDLEDATSRRFHVLPELHSKDFQYGNVILLALETVVYPNICEGCESLSDVLLHFIDCQAVGIAINDEISLIPASLATTACTLGLTTGIEQLEGLVETLSAGPVINPTTKEIEGLAAAGEFYLTDEDRDFQTETVGDMSMFLQWRGFEDEAMAEDISAPITGHGRIKAAFCTRDGDCGQDGVCTPIASYLEVALVEMDCRARVGEQAGMAECAGDSDCESGLCFAPAEGTQICFEACSVDAHCVGGSCTEEAAALSLDDVMDGLGEVSVGACVPD